AANETSGKPYFDVEGFDAASGILTLKPVGLNAANKGKTIKKITLDVTVRGYDPFVYGLNIRTVDSKPAIKVSEAVFYKGTAKAAAVLDKPVGPLTTVSCDDVLLSAVISSDKRSVILTLSEGFKAGNKKLTFDDPSWCAPVTLQVKVSIKPAPSVKLTKTSLKLNSALSCDEYGMYEIKAEIPGSMLKASVTGVAGVNDAASLLVSSGFLKAEISGDTVSFGLVPSKRGTIKAGTYRYDLGLKIADAGFESVNIKPLRISITVADRDPGLLASLKASGSINLTDRADTCIAYNLTLSDINAARAASVSLKGDNAGSFSARLFTEGEILPNGTPAASPAGTVAIQAREGAQLKANTGYPLTVVLTLDNGFKAEKPVTVKGSHSPKKTVLSPATLNVPMNSGAVRFEAVSAALTDNDSIIEKVELIEDSTSGFFEYIPAAGAGSGSSYAGTVRVLKQIKKTGTYKLNFNVTYKDHAVNVKPARLTLTVVVK
nr:hypothetical protein [Lachnospiraceae bacterium]